MREILFRGKRVDNGEWVYGNYVEDEQGASILYQYPKHGGLTRERIYSETVGQYTGIKDKNGNKIFEGDIIRFIKENCLVNFVENDCAFRIEVDGRISTALRKAHSKDYEVIGNIHDEEE